MLGKQTYIAFLLCICPLAFSQKFSILTEGGAGYRLYIVQDSVTPAFKEYKSKQRIGNVLSIEPVWYSENQGFGVKYSLFYNSNTADSIKVSNIETKSISELVKLHYCGLQYHKRYANTDSKWSREYVAGLGMIFYRNYRKEFKSIDYKIIGHTYAVNASFSIEYSIIKSISIFTSCGFFISNINEVTENGATVLFQPRESLTRIDLNGGIRVNLF